jgi:hypothetical protein
LPGSDRFLFLSGNGTNLYAIIANSSIPASGRYFVVGWYDT